MKITEVQIAKRTVSLVQPYEIAGARFESTDLVYVRLCTDKKLHGFGAASPMTLLTGEKLEDCASALEPARLRWLAGYPVKDVTRALAIIQADADAGPAARSALEMALYDLCAKSADMPLVDFLGRQHERLPTSVTIGITAIAQMLSDAQQWVDAGFGCLKIKIGRDVLEDVARLTQLREKFRDVAIRVDANQGYSLEETTFFIEKVRTLNLEFCEQPFSSALGLGNLTTLTERERNQIALDESIGSACDVDDYISSSVRLGVINLKVMKLGFECARQAAVKLNAIGQSIMWGCVDESVVSIAAALHLAYAAPATRYLDLDGHLDLDELASAGLEIGDGGHMALRGGAGLGVNIQEEVFR